MSESKPSASGDARAPAGQSGSAATGPADVAASASGAPEFPKRLRARTFVVPVLAASIAVALLPFTGRTWGLIDTALHVEPFHAILRHLSVLGEWPAYGAAAVLIWCFDPRRRRAVAVMLLAVLLGGGVNAVLKNTLRRARPDYGMALDAKQIGKNRAYLLEHPNAPIAAESSDQWLLLRSAPGLSMYHFNSFPSGHTVSAFALCAFLIAVYPRARWLWLFAAALCAASRVTLRAHYVEDVIFGAALGWSVAWVAFAWPWLARLSGRVADVLDRKGRGARRDSAA